MIGGIGLAVAGATIGITSVAAAASSAIGRLKAEFLDIERYQKLAAQANMTLGEARAGARLNKPAGMAEADFDRIVRESAKAAGAKESTAYQAWGSILSAAGDLPVSAQQSVLTETLRMKRLVPQMDAPGFAGRMMDIMKVTGLKDASTAVGWGVEFQKKARLTDIAASMELLGPVLLELTGKGMTAEEAAEAAAAASQVMQDPTGQADEHCASRICLENIRQGSACPQKGTGRQGNRHEGLYPRGNAQGKAGVCHQLVGHGERERSRRASRWAREGR